MEHNVALVDDHHLVRSGLVATVNALGGYRVCMEAGHGRELVDALVALHPGHADEPAIAIVDLNMPVMDGYETLEWLREHRPGIRSLALTFDATDEALVKAVRSGARGFLLKNARPAVLKTALDALVATGYYYTDSTHHTLQDNPGLRTAQERERDAVMAQISPRELEFLHHVCSPEEHTYEAIAGLMGVHRRTVDNYRVALFEKFAIKSKTGLVLFALRWGLITV
ncbi:MAG TPA: response regulator transcription factor [Flavobacteriales bacterium]|nr:response regulator transcription factor [Flavobacteriales bacterium]